VLSGRLVKIFRKKFNVNQNLQFLLFGQIIPEGGFKQEAAGQKRSLTFKSMKTNDLRDQRQEELHEQDDTDQYLKSRHLLNQFNQIKKILMNFAFKDKGKAVLSTEIIQHVMDEMRRERKIYMVLRDVGVEEYCL